MAVTLLSLVPVGLGLFLLAFGDPERPLLAPRARNVVAVALLAVAAGPVALGLLGLVGWLAVPGLLIVGVLLATALRTPGRPAQQYP